MTFIYSFFFALTCFLLMWAFAALMKVLSVQILIIIAIFIWFKVFMDFRKNKINNWQLLERWFEDDSWREIE